MNNQEIKELLSTQVLSQINDKSIENILRGIIFDLDNTIDWKHALNLVLKYMPEIKIS